MKLVSNIEGTRWSFLDGYSVYSNVVYLMGLDDVRKYKLINENGEDLKVNVKNYLVEE